MRLQKEELVNYNTFSSGESIKHHNGMTWLSFPEKIIIYSLFTDGKPAGRGGGKRKKRNCLDIGCGGGRTTFRIKQRGINVIGIDISPTMVSLAKKQYKKIDFRVIDACDLSAFPNSFFDYVLFSFNGIDYIYPEERREKCLKEIHRVIKKGGIFAFSSHNSLCLPYQYKLLRNKVYNLFRLRVFARYRYAFNKYGITFVHYINCFNQKRILERLGFKDIKLIGRNTYGGKVGSILFDNAPYYICTK